MGYSQKPGRSPMLKTGRGLSPALMSCSPMKQGDIELTKEYSTGVRKKAVARGRSGSESLKNNSQGIVIDAASGMATAKPYEKKFVKNEKTGGASIIGGDNKTVSTASSYGKGREVEKLRQKYVSDSTSTMNNRNRNVEQYNITSGAKSTNIANDKEKKLLVKLGQAKHI
jgi:hypothetical protein